MKKIKLFSTDAVSHKLAFDVENEVNEFCKDKKVMKNKKTMQYVFKFHLYF